MSIITVSDLTPIGSDLFQDSESFLQELHDREIELIRGGAEVSQVTVSAGYQVVTNNSELALLADGIGVTEPLLI